MKSSWGPSHLTPDPETLKGFLSLVPCTEWPELSFQLWSNPSGPFFILASFFSAYCYSSRKYSSQNLLQLSSIWVCCVENVKPTPCSHVYFLYFILDFFWLEFLLCFLYHFTFNFSVLWFLRGISCKQHIIFVLIH